MKILALNQEQTSSFSSFLLASGCSLKPPDGYRASREGKGPHDGLQMWNVWVRKGCVKVAYPPDLTWLDHVAPISWFAQGVSFIRLFALLSLNSPYVY